MPIFVSRWFIFKKLYQIVILSQAVVWLNIWLTQIFQMEYVLNIYRDILRPIPTRLFRSLLNIYILVIHTNGRAIKKGICEIWIVLVGMGLLGARSWGYFEKWEIRSWVTAISQWEYLFQFWIELPSICLIRLLMELNVFEFWYLNTSKQQIKLNKVSYHCCYLI